MRKFVLSVIFHVIRCDGQFVNWCSRADTIKVAVEADNAAELFQEAVFLAIQEMSAKVRSDLKLPSGHSPVVISHTLVQI